MYFDNSVLGLIKARLSSHGSIEIASSGHSMFPFIIEGDVCSFSASAKNDLSRGDVALFVTPDGRLIAHRVLRVLATKEGTTLLCKGDTNRYPDVPVLDDVVLAKLVTICRGRRRIDVFSLHRRIWTWGILKIPAVTAGCRSFIIHKNIWMQRMHKFKGTFHCGSHREWL